MGLLNKTDNPQKLSSKDKIKFLAKDTLFFGSLKLISLSFPFISIPLLTRYFSITEFGILDSLTIFANFLTLFLVFGQDSSVARWFYQFANECERKKVISNSLIMQLIFGFAAVLIVFIFTKEMSNFYLSDKKYSFFILVFSIQSFFLLLNNFSVNLLKWTFNRRNYAIISIIHPVSMLFSLLIAMYLELSLFTYVSINLFFALCVAVIGLFMTRKWFIWNLDKILIKKLFYYGAPFGIIASSAALMPAVDRQMITKFLSFNDLGQYAFGFKIASLITAANGMFQMAWGPFSYSVYKEEDSSKVFNIIIKGYIITFIFFVFSLVFISPYIIPYLGTSEYFAALPVVLPLASAQFVYGLAGLTGIGVSLSMKSYLYIFPFVISIILLIILNHFLIPSLGIVGASYSVLISFSIQLIVVTYLSFKSYPLGIDFLSLFVIVFFVILTSLILNQYLSNLIWFVCSTSVLLIFSWLGLLNKAEKQYFISYINKFLNFKGAD